jgi:hypothetical protein
MRNVLCFVAAVCVLASSPAEGQGPPKQIVTPNDQLAAALWRIATVTNTRIGFESTDHVHISGALKRLPELSVSSLEDGLDTVVGADDRYEWRKIGDIAVVRPKRAWGDPNNPFNRHVRNVQVRNEGLTAVLLAIRDLIYTDKFTVVSKPTTEVPLSFELQTGTIVDVLNHVMVAGGQVFWTASYRPLDQPGERWQYWDLVLEMRDAVFTNSMSGSSIRGVR